MAEDPSKQRLGRGLAALIGEMDKPVSKQAGDAPGGEADRTMASDRTVPIESIVANPKNPRRQFTESELEDLAGSISEHGLIQPILVRSAPRSVGHHEGVAWEIIAGERRWRAAQRAGVHSVPIVVREVDDRQALELAIIENVQRADLNPVEEAMGYQQLIDEHQYKQADLGKVIGKSRSHVANTLRLLKLPDSVRGMLSSGVLSPGHARALITLDHPENLARRIVDEGLSVRQVEQLVSVEDRPKDLETKSAKSVRKGKDADTKSLENRLSNEIGMKVIIDHKPNGKGKLTIMYKSLEQLDELEKRLSRLDP